MTKAVGVRPGAVGSWPRPWGCGQGSLWHGQGRGGGAKACGQGPWGPVLYSDATMELAYQAVGQTTSGLRRTH